MIVDFTTQFQFDLSNLPHTWMTIRGGISDKGSSAFNLCFSIGHAINSSWSVIPSSPRCDGDLYELTIQVKITLDDVDRVLYFFSFLSSHRSKSLMILKQGNQWSFLSDADERKPSERWKSYVGGKW